MRLAYEKAALKGLSAMPPRTAEIVRVKLLAIAADPYGHHPKAAPLTGTDAGFRLRQGDWRIVYRLDRRSETMIVEWIGPRGGAYR